MDISLVSIAFDGYGRFIGQFLAFVSNMTPKPKEIIIMLGKNHDCQDLKAFKEWYPNVSFYEYKKKATFGNLRNIAIGKASNEWIWFVSIDDKVQSDAIRTFKRATKDGDDYICSQWYTIGLGQSLEPHYSPTPEEMVQSLQRGERGGFIIPHSPFKRELWVKHPYKNSDLPNYDFLLHCVLNGARFVKGDKPTTTYLRRPDSHARAVLPSIRKQANREKKKMQDGVVEYYNRGKD